jgi:D-3-phosphoglycerate dehydrogenase
VNCPKERKVVVTQRFFDAETMSYLRSNDCELVVAELPPGQADGEVPHEMLLQWLKGAAGWIVGHARVTRELLTELPELQVISRRGVGYDRVDVTAVRDLGRVATIAAGGNDATVADQTIGLMLALGRRFR